jgi:hypothetical protein
MKTPDSEEGITTDEFRSLDKAQGRQGAKLLRTPPVGAITVAGVADPGLVSSQCTGLSEAGYNLKDPKFQLGSVSSGLSTKPILRWRDFENWSHRP